MQHHSNSAQSGSPLSMFYIVLVRLELPDFFKHVLTSYAVHMLMERLATPKL